MFLLTRLPTGNMYLDARLRSNGNVGSSLFRKLLARDSRERRALRPRGRRAPRPRGRRATRPRGRDPLTGQCTVPISTRIFALFTEP